MRGRAAPLHGPLLIVLAALAILFAPADAQTGRTYRVGYVGGPAGLSSDRTGTSALQAFRAALDGLGYVEDSNLVLDVRIADRELTRVPALVEELIALRPDVLVGWDSIAQVMREKTTSIPIVLAGAIDPVRTGLAHSLRRPGMNVTGVAQLNDQLPAKHIDIMREINPRLARVGMIVDTTAPGCKVVEETARQASHNVGAVFVPYYVSNRDEIARAFAGMNKERPDVLLPCPSAVLFAFRDLLFENAVRLRIPFTSFIVVNVPRGVLFSYATSLPDIHRAAATYVDKILKGARPGDLPIEQPTTFQLVINLQTAQALGLKIPSSVLMRADRVIE